MLTEPRKRAFEERKSYYEILEKTQSGSLDITEWPSKDRKEGARLVWRQKPEQQQWLEAAG